jgi:demethylmenaquinone methyltransferase/2-methoxy-6-polyprenyl-1,4-benzoquinol methylase
VKTGVGSGLWVSYLVLMQKSYVRSLFDDIAHRYDLLNHLLSGGIDFYWRRRAIQHLVDVEPRRILDVATGTADFAIAALHLHPIQVVGVDVAEEMLKYARKKLEKRGLEHLISVQQGEAENLRFETGSFDAAIAAFGARNFHNLPKGLAEMHRVLRPGGKIVVLEFSRPTRFPFKQSYFFYFKNIVPLVGRIISRHEYAYQYLPDTVMRFPEGQEFLKILRGVGFAAVAQERLTFGIATIYTGMK